MNRVALLLLAMTTAFLLTGTLLEVGLEPVLGSLALDVVPIALAVVGALIAARHPGNPIGWLFCGMGLLDGLETLTHGYGLRAAAEGLPVGEIAEWISSWIWIPMIALWSLVFLLFPDGRLPSRRWRFVAWLSFAGCALAAPGHALDPTDEDFINGGNPLGVEGAAIELLFEIGITLLSAAFLASAVSLIIRFGRARGVERQQLKWFASAAALVALCLLIMVFFTGWNQSVFVQAMVALALGSIPIASGIAILRYRLYDIDVVINRTLVYGTLTATLGGAYLGTVLVLQLLLGPLAEDNSLAIAGSTLAIAALFRPARSRIQAVVDRRFFRHKYDASRTLERFSAGLRNEVDLGALGAELAGVVTETMQPAHVSLWLREAPR